MNDYHMKSFPIKREMQGNQQRRKEKEEAPRVKHLRVVCTAGLQRRGTAAGCGFKRISVPLFHGHALMQEVLKEGCISPRYLLILF